MEFMMMVVEISRHCLILKDCLLTNRKEIGQRHWSDTIYTIYTIYISFLYKQLQPANSTTLKMTLQVVMFFN